MTPLFDVLDPSEIDPTIIGTVTSEWADTMRELGAVDVKQLRL